MYQESALFPLYRVTFTANGNNMQFSISASVSEPILQLSIPLAAV